MNGLYPVNYRWDVRKFKTATLKRVVCSSKTNETTTCFVLVRSFTRFSTERKEDYYRAKWGMSRRDGRRRRRRYCHRFNGHGPFDTRKPPAADGTQCTYVNTVLYTLASYVIFYFFFPWESKAALRQAREAHSRFCPWKTFFCCCCYILQLFPSPAYSHYTHTHNLL